MNLPNDIKVSVIILTYNHEKFIKKAIENTLNQTTNFKYEIFIADDYSTDTTQQIINEAISNNPQNISVTYIRNSKNIGVMQSWRNIHNKLNGKYFAICEGDDYWTDTLKLQKQVNFLENSPDFSICFHNVEVKYLDIPLPSFYLNDSIEKDVFTINDLIGTSEIWFMATASLMIRTGSLKDIPDWIIKSKSGDIPLIILAAVNGKIKYLSETMAVYQKHLKGMSMTDHKNDAIFLKNRIFMYKMLNIETKYQFNDRLKQNIAGYYYLLLDSNQYKNHYFARLFICFRYIYLKFPNIPNFKTLFKNYIIPLKMLQLSRLIKKKIGLIN